MAPGACAQNLQTMPNDSSGPSNTFRESRSKRSAWPKYSARKEAPRLATVLQLSADECARCDRIGAFVEQRPRGAVVQSATQPHQAASAPERRRELGAEAGLDGVRQAEAVRGFADVALEGRDHFPVADDVALRREGPAVGSPPGEADLDERRASDRDVGRARRVRHAGRPVEAGLIRDAEPHGRQGARVRADEDHEHADRRVELAVVRVDARGSRLLPAVRGHEALAVHAEPCPRQRCADLDARVERHARGQARLEDRRPERSAAPRRRLRQLDVCLVRLRHVPGEPEALVPEAGAEPGPAGGNAYLGDWNQGKAGRVGDRGLDAVGDRDERPAHARRT